MNQYDTPYFPVDFILNYIKNEKVQGLKRVQTYAAFRFLAALTKEHPDLVRDLAAHSRETLTMDGFDKISAYLEADLYFSPSFKISIYYKKNKVK